jgi:predicted PurR-regulated permease PerM
MEATTSRTLKIVSLSVLIVVSTILLYISRTAVILSVIGIGIGALCTPLLNQLRKRFRIPRSLSALVLFLLVCLFLGGTIVGLFLMVSDQATNLASQAPEIIKNLQGRLSALLVEYPWLEEQVNDINISATIRKGFGNIFAGAYSGAVAVSGLVFALILGLYTAVNSQYYFEATVQAFPADSRREARIVLAKCGAVLRQWFRAQLIDMAIIGGLTALGLWLIGADYWALFGLLTAVMGIIPYVGTLLVVIAAALITLASNPSQVPAVVGVFFLTQQIEGNLLLPIVMKGAADLPEVPLLIFMLFLGGWFGLIGVFIAPPLFAVLRTLYLMLYLPRVEAKKETRRSSPKAIALDVSGNA